MVVGFAIFQCAVVGLFAALALLETVPAISTGWLAGKAASLTKTLRPFDVPVLLVFAGLAVSLVFLLRKNLAAWLLASSTASLGLLVGALTAALPAVEAESSARPVAQVLMRARRGDEPMLTGKFLARGIIFYTHAEVRAAEPAVRVLAKKEQPFWAAHPIPVIVWKKGLRDFLKEHPTALCALRRGEWEAFDEEDAFATRDGFAEFGENVVVRALREPAPSIK